MIEPSVICILGMHRSGTSCLTGCLQDFGLHLGEVVNYTWDNLKGNRENLEIRAINEDVLRFNGGSWRNPPKKVKWNTSLQQRRDDAIATRSGSKVWGFKDPRTLLTLPFWLEAIPNMNLIGTFRHPLAVANSLSQRDQSNANHALVLWTHYNEKLLEYASEFDFPLVCFDWPADQYCRSVASIATEFGLDRKEDFDTVPFFEDEMRKRQNFSSTSSMSEQTENLYRQLLNRCAA